MKLFLSEKISLALKEKSVLLDNDFLSQLFFDQEVLTKTLALLGSSYYILIDPFVEFEFLRDVFLPEQLGLRKEFLSNEIFLRAPNHTEIFRSLQTNALLLSQIYAHHNQKGNAGSIVDLFLASRVMYTYQAVLLTGNRKHFPSCVFDTLGVINIPQKNDDTMRAFSLVEFNKSKFDTCLNQLQRLTRENI